MAREPSFPRDASVGVTPNPAPPEPEAPAAAKPTRAKSAKAPSEPTDEKPAAGESRRAKHIVAGAAIGIGSAAIVAALLYANRSRRNDRN